MSTAENGSKSLLVVTQQEAPSFLNDEIQLKDLLKRITKISKEAIDVLVDSLKSQDEKIRFNAASKILEFQVQIAKEINTDKLQRLMAEYRIKGAPAGKLVPVEDDKPVRPVVDFTTIRSIE